SFRDFTCFAVLLLWIGSADSARGQQGVAAADAAPVTLLGSVSTASPAQTIGINGNTVYTCDNNEIAIIDVSRPSAPGLITTANSPTNTTNTFCDVQRGQLVQMINTSPPTFRVFDLSNPNSPNLIASPTVNKQFFGPPYFEGNTAFFGANVIVFGSGYPGPVTDQAGDF